MSASDVDRIDSHPTLLRVKAQGISFSFDPDCGIISDFVVADQGHRISMMHRAPWVGSDIVLPAGAPTHQARLEGDFFCAPFSDASADGAPLHGWPANGQWLADGATAANTLRCTLHQTVMGATVVKELSLTDNHPFLYQRHTFTGGHGEISAANHAMIALPKGGHLRFSAKRWFETSPYAPESDPARGRSCLKYPARSTNPRHFPAADGGIIDLTNYPFGDAHEDFVTAVEAAESPLGWTAVTRPTEGDLYLSLRNPKRLPATMLWHSNGGRDYAPWLGRHRGCLGVEEGVAENLLSLLPDTQVDLHHITGCIAWPSGEAVQSVTLGLNTLVVQGEQGARRELPICGDFLQI